MPPYVRLRILFAIAVVTLAGSVFAVLQSQRASDNARYAGFSAVQELRSAATRLAFAVGDAAEDRAAATRSVAAAERAYRTANRDARSRVGRGAPLVTALLDRQEAVGSALITLAHRALRGAPAREVKARRDVLLERTIEIDNELLTQRAAQRAADDSSVARVPAAVILVVAVFFALVYVFAVERPALRERRAGKDQQAFGAAMQAARSEAEAYDMLARHVGQVAETHDVTVLNRNNSADRLEPATPVQAGSAAAEILENAKPDDCLAIRLARTYRPDGPTGTLLVCEICGKSAAQMMCVPSIVGGEVVGSVLVTDSPKLEARRRQRVEQSVSEAAPVITNLRNLAVAEIRAATDGLTGLPNQRAVHDMINRSAAIAGRTVSQLALILFDLDEFKAINDTYGHGKGDEVLAMVGAVAAGTIRQSDFVGRLGGEEFATLLPATDRSGAVEVAEKLRAAIAAIAIPGVARAVTASFGVAVLPDDAGEPKRLLREADRALYAAKNAGRNRVETAHTAPAVEPELIA